MNCKDCGTIVDRPKAPAGSVCTECNKKYTTANVCQTCGDIEYTTKEQTAQYRCTRCKRIGGNF